MAYMRLGDLLVSSGIITGEQLEQALALPREDGQRLGDVLIRQGVISEAQLIDALRVQLGVDFVDLTAVSIPVELAKYVPRNLAKKFLVVPVKLVQDRLYLAMHDPLDFVAQDEVKTASRKRIIPMIATRHAVGEAVAALVFVSLLLRYDISLRTLEAWAVACLLLACAFADLEGYIIPDRFIAVGVVLFIVTLFFVPDPGKRALDGLIGGVAVGGGVLLLALLMEKLLRRDAMGGGDIKLLFLTGLFLGWQKNLLCLLLACVVGILWGLIRAKRGQQGLPWGPGIALAAWCAALFGQNLIDWYLSLL